MSDETKPAGVKASARGWSGALIVSLCLNFLLIGALVTLGWRFYRPAMPPSGYEQGMGDRHGHGHGYGQGKGRGMGFGLGHGPLNPQVLAHLAPEKADAIGRIVESHRGRFETLRTASFAARDRSERILAAENYSQAEFESALAKVREADNALEAEVLSTVAECAAQLTPEERRAAIVKKGRRMSAPQ